ncbi:MAG: cupin domain-containing protein [Anaerolineales bacterium]|nr:cupin domain-containing protein [Anaerolineales bacterium]MBS3752161.1 cupin domain-containing protein [Anaerolineales bacterium]
MKKTYTYLKDLPVSDQDVPPDSILSQTVFEDGGVKVILFSFAPEQELSEHTASVPAILHFLDGNAHLVLGEEEQEAGPGTWVHMPANLPHSIFAKSNLTMLLYLLEQ